MRARVAISVTAVLLMVPSNAAGRETTAPRVTWASAATAACQSMWERMESYPRNYWRPLEKDRPLSRIAVLRREWLVIHQDRLRAIRPRATAKPPPARRAVRHYGHIPDTIRRHPQ